MKLPVSFNGCIFSLILLLDITVGHLNLICSYFKDYHIT